MHSPRFRQLSSLMGAGFAALMLTAPVVNADDPEPVDPAGAAAQETQTADAVGLAEPVAPQDTADAEPAPGADTGTASGPTPASAADEAEPEPTTNVAENVDLSQPVDPASMQIGVETRGEMQTDWSAPNIPLTYSSEQPPLFLLGTEIPTSTSARLSWSPEQSFDGIAVPTPVLVVNGAQRGPVLCLTAAVHGDELNGIEVVRRVMYDLDPQKLSGAVIGVPIVNLQGFRRGSRYLPDRRDLNRFFPGNPNGSLASRIAHSFFTEVIDHCEALVDLHTGSFKRTNLPQLRADLRNPDVVELTRGFGSTVVLHSAGSGGTLRRAATDRGIPAVTLEAGEPARLQENEVEHGTKGVMTLLTELGMYRKVTFWGSREPVYYRSTWVRADRGGVLFSEVELGERVDKDQVLGTITDPITNVKSTLRSTERGRVLGMALNQFVMPGFAAFRIGIETAEATATPADSGESSTHTARAGNDAEIESDEETEAEEADAGVTLTDEGDDLENSE